MQRICAYAEPGAFRVKLLSTGNAYFIVGVRNSVDQQIITVPGRHRKYTIVGTPVSHKDGRKFHDLDGEV